MSAKKTTTTATKPLKDLRVAIVHDWLIGGGAEKVVLELHHIFPYADIYTSYATKEWKHNLDGMVKTGILQHWPFSKMRKFLPLLRIWWFERLKLEGYDLVISSSGAEAKGIKVPEGTLHINYCHAPTHYYWSRYDEYMKHPGFGIFNPLARLGLRLLVGPLRKWDYEAAQRPDYMIANSTHIKNEIKKYYGREAKVIFPPVDLDAFKPNPREHIERYGFIITGRQTPYKRFDLAVSAASAINAPLKVIGKGPDYPRLTAMAGPSVRFLGYLPTDQVAHHVQKAEAFLFPGVDDFGISPVEAMAAGTPVIAFKGGGALDYVIPGVTGEFFEDQSIDALAPVLKAFKPEAYDQKKIMRRAQKFGVRQFHTKMEKYVLNCIGKQKP
jgi:glycosyltransferase involved in cell wall biosynthesis